MTATQEIERMKADALALNLPKSPIEIDAQIIFNRPNCLMVCRIVEVREKAVRVDYANEPIMSNCAVTVYTYSCWIPKSAIIHNEYGGLITKKWFENKFEGGYKIKPYFVQNGKITLV
jgi:hypothetical protein